MSTGDEWRLDASDGELRVYTGVEGRAARMGHRLTLAMTDWRATVSFTGAEPSAVELVVAVDGLQVVRGEGGVTPLSGPEKAVVRANALNCFAAQRYPHIRFQSATVEPTGTGYRLTGEVEIHGVTRAHTVDVEVTDAELSARTTLRQRDFKMKPYSMLMGAMKVADEVTVSLTARRPAPAPR